MGKRSWWDTLWGNPEKINEQQAKYTGPLPYSSLTDFPVGKTLNDTILAGLSGKNWGFGEDFVNRSTSPAVAQLQADWPRTLRETQDVYSARGLGRGTAVGRDIGLAASQRDRDINSIIANAYLTNEQQKKQDEANWQARGAGYAGQEVGTRAGAAGFGLNQMGAENAANLENNALTRQYNQDSTSALNRMIGTGINLLSPAVGGYINTIGTNIGGDAGKFISDLGTGLKNTPSAFLKSQPTDFLSMMKLALAGGI